MQNNDKNIDIYETENYGVCLKVSDKNIADDIEDYIAENYYIPIDIKFENDVVYFYFGQASSIQKVEGILKKYKES